MATILQSIFYAPGIMLSTGILWKRRNMVAMVFLPCMCLLHLVVRSLFRPIWKSFLALLCLMPLTVLKVQTLVSVEWPSTQIHPLFPHNQFRPCILGKNTTEIVSRSSQDNTWGHSALTTHLTPGDAGPSHLLLLESSNFDSCLIQPLLWWIPNDNCLFLSFILHVLVSVLQ